MIQKEVAMLSSNVIMKQKDVNCYKNIDVTMATNALILFSLLQACLKTKGPRTNMKELVAVVVAIFCKHHWPGVCLLQKIFSSFYASKQVSRLNLITECNEVLFHRFSKKLGCV